LAICEQDKIMETTQKRYYRAKEVAEFLGIALSTVWLYAKQGKLTPKKLSSRVTVFEVSEMNSLIQPIE
jgi:predicted DNA-binding transcriptional regulator AlpA